MDVNSREAKLAVAKKKLKIFQQRQQRTSPKSVPGDRENYYYDQEPLGNHDREAMSKSSESLAESSVSLPVGYYNYDSDNLDKERLEKRASLGFYHDEHCSPFQRVKRPSESSEFSSNTFRGLGGDNLGVYQVDDDDAPSSTNSIIPEFAQPNIAQPNDTYNSLPAASALFADSEPKEGSSVLQKENDQLRVQLQQHVDYSQQLLVQYEELKAHYARLHELYSISHSTMSQTDNSRELENLQRENRQHVQTLSVLVDEKSELQSQLRQAMKLANDSHVENAELKERLRVSQERITALQGEATALAERHEKNSQNVSQVADLQTKFSYLQSQLEDVEQQRGELAAKLKTKNNSIQQLELKLEEVTNQLSLRDIYIQQLSGEGESSKSVAEKLQQTISKLEAECKRHKDSVEHWKRECDEARQRYENYSGQLQQNIGLLTRELDAARMQCTDLELAYKTLQNELTVLNEQKAAMASSPTEQLSPEQVNALTETIAILRSEIEQSEGRFKNTCLLLEQKTTELDEAHRQIAEQASHARNLEGRLVEHTQYSSDAGRLLEELHNERATVSRAVQQNQTLKAQLVELEDRFVAITTKHMEAETNLQSTVHALESLRNQIERKDVNIDTVKLQHEQDIARLKQQLSEAEKQLFQHSQLEDRLRHYESVYPMAARELDDLKEKLRAVTSDNDILKQQCSFLTHQNHTQASHGQKIADVEREKDSLITKNKELQTHVGRLQQEQQQLQAQLQQDDVNQQIASMQRNLDQVKEELKRAQGRADHLARENTELHQIMDQNSEDENQNSIKVELQNALDRITQLVSENRQLQRLLDDAHAHGRTSTSPFANGHDNDVENGELADQNQQKNIPDDVSVCSEHTEQRRDVVSSEAFDSLKRAMEQLQARFSQAMSHNADLADHNEQLEHLIVQLQGETDTIGEYITLYQHQRKAVRERMRAKDEYIAKLSHERESMQTKLRTLRQLMMEVMHEKGALHMYHHIDTLKNQLAASQASNLDEGVGVSPITSPSSHESNGGDFPAEKGETADSETDTVLNCEHNKKDFVDRSTPHSATDQLLRLLNEIQEPDLADRLPITERSLHCRYCSGKLQVV